MKYLVLKLTICVIGCFLLTGCANKSGKITDKSNASTFTAPFVFESFEDYETIPFDAQTSRPNPYILKELPTGFNLSQISLRENVYVTVEYKIQMDETLILDETLNDYEKERLSTIICKRDLYGEGQNALKLSYIDKGFSPVEYDGKIYYYFEEFSLDGQKLIGHELAFLEENVVMYIHLPAIDTLDNMINYAKVTEKID